MNLEGHLLRMLRLGEGGNERRMMAFLGLCSRERRRLR